MRAIWQRLDQSPVFWSWAFNFFRLGSGVLLLPLLLRVLTESDLGMYYVFLGLVSLVPLIDNAFSFNIARFVGYALGGAREIQALGMPPPSENREPNHALIWELLLATQALYFRIAAATVLSLGVIGWLIVHERVAETSNVDLTWFAGAMTLVAAGAEILSSWWNSFLRGLNRVRDGARISTIAYASKLVLSCALLLGGLGLAAIPVAGLMAAAIQRYLSRRYCLALLPAGHRPSESVPIAELVAKIWPNSWRVGLQLMSGYLAFNGAAVLCLHYFGLSVNAQLGLSWQILMMIQGVATVWTQVEWPRVAQYRARNDEASIVEVMRPRMIRQLLTFIVLAAGLLLVGQQVLLGLGSGKQLLPLYLLAVMAMNMFLEMHFSFWTILLATENRVPSLWSTVATNLLVVVMAFALLQFLGCGIAGLVWAPLVCGCSFNYWYWPIIGAQNVKTTWLQFIFGRGGRNRGTRIISTSAVE